MIDVYCFHQLDQVARFEPELDALNLASRRKDPFSTFRFMRNLAAHPAWYPGDLDVEPWFLIAMRDDRLVGYLALRRTWSRVMGVRSARLEFFVTHDHDCPQLVARPEDEHDVAVACYRYLLSRQDDWTFLDLQDQDPGSPLTPPPAEVPLHGYYVRTFPAVENNTIPVTWKGLDAYVKALGSNWRRHVRRKTQKLFAAGKLQWISSSDPRATPALLDVLAVIERKSWKATHATALASHPDRLAYFRGLLAADQPMAMTVSALLLDGVPIGGSICGLYGGTCFGLVIVFDDRAEQLSPGVILQLMMMRTAIDGGARALNLLRGFSYYKQHWLAQPLPTGNGQLYRIGKPWFWRAIVGDFRRKVTQLVAASPAFNPDRRAGEQKPAPIAATAAEQKELSAILARLSGARVERLGPRELAAVLPFGENTQPGEEPAAPALH